MKGDAKVIEYLNAALRSELTAVSQYWLHFRLQEDWGFGHLAAKSRAELTERYQKLQRDTVLPQLKNGLSALVYTRKFEQKNAS